jgi:hypothetical protein
VQTRILKARNQRRRYLGLLLCVLAVVFAVSAKTALYRSNQKEVRALTSSKMWRNSAQRSDAEVTVPVPVPIAFAILLLMFTVLLVVVAVASSEQPEARKTAWFSTSLSVRPPPVL